MPTYGLFVRLPVTNHGRRDTAREVGVILAHVWERSPDLVLRPSARTSRAGLSRRSGYAEAFGRVAIGASSATMGDMHARACYLLNCNGVTRCVLREKTRGRARTRTQAAARGTLARLTGPAVAPAYPCIVARVDASRFAGQLQQSREAPQPNRI